MSGWRRRTARLLGSGTALYGISVMFMPRSLARQCALRDVDAASTRLLAYTFGVRDTASGVSILRARSRESLRTALVLRGLMDGGDAIACALLLTDPGARARVTGVAGTWALLCFAVAATL